MVHGRGAGPADILDLVPLLARPNLAYLAPAAANRTWYPLQLHGRDREQRAGPFVRAGPARVGRRAGRAAGIPRSRTVLLGFSQGACLAAEFAVRHASRFGGVIVFSGGAIGPPGTRWDDAGRFDGTPVFLGCSDRDAMCPKRG